MKELELLQQKLEQLLKHYAALQADKERMGKTIDKQAAIIHGQREKLESLETELKLKSVALSAGGTDNDQKENLKKHLDDVIREIERNIEML